MSPRDQATAAIILRRWWSLYKAGRFPRDPDIIKLATETDAYINPVYEAPSVTYVGNIKDVIGDIPK